MPLKDYSAIDSLKTLQDIAEYVNRAIEEFAPPQLPV